MKYLIIALVLLFNGPLVFGQVIKNGDKEEIDQILANAGKFSQYVMDSDYEKIGASYTSDGKIFPNRSKILTGVEDIIKYWKLPDGVSTSHHKIFPSEITIVGNTAYDYGYYEGKTKQANGQISSWEGKYVIVWKKVGSAWKMYLDIWNNTK